VLPRTVVLEDERHQQELREQAIKRIEGAADLLRRHGIVIAEHNPAELIPPTALLTALESTGIRVETEEPTLDEYRDAERRASLHLPPQSPDKKSDEMRDLTIWAVALRVARRDGSAMLVSRDEVHSGTLGSIEAESARLLLASSFDEALDLLGRLSPEAELAESVLKVVWDALKKDGLPLPDEIPRRAVSQVHFVADQDGHANTSLLLELPTEAGGIRANVRVFQIETATVQADVTDIRAGGTQWRSGSSSVKVNGELPRVTRPMDERMSELKNILKEKS
jgi:hypothetical protein